MAAKNYGTASQNARIERQKENRILADEPRRKKSNAQLPKPGKGTAMRAVPSRKPPAGRDTGNRKTTFYANGTARVWDSKLSKFATVTKKDSRYPTR
jgi:hypothetical protein